MSSVGRKGEGKAKAYRLLVRDALAWQWSEGCAPAHPTTCTGACTHPLHTQQPPGDATCTHTPSLAFEGRFQRMNVAVDACGRFVNVSGDADPADADTVIEAEGRVMLPGLIDSHIHVCMTGETKYFLDLQGCGSIEQLQNMLRAHAVAHPDVSWIIGVKWEQDKLSRYPNRVDLDEAVADRPVFLWRACWHIGVANTAALVLGGVLDKHTQSSTHLRVEGGAIDEVDGVPTGVLRERAVELLTRSFQHKRPDEVEKFIVEGIQTCLRNGLTAVQSNDENAVDTYLMLQQQSRLPMRVFLTPTHAELSRDNPPLSPIIPSFLRETSSQEDLGAVSSMFCVDRVKIFADGSLGAETAALRTPYVNPLGREGRDAVSVGNMGLLVHEDDHMRAMIAQARERGFRLEVHAIGDRAAQQVVEALESCGVVSESRPVLTHCQVLGSDIIQKMRENGVIANVQPSFVPTDMEWVRKRLPESIQETSYCWNSLLKAGVACAGGSDSPVENCSPLIGIYDAVYRKARGLEQVFLEIECLTFAQALGLYTIGGAYASRCESVLGKICEGYAGDIVLLDTTADVSAAPHLLSSVEVWCVCVGGNVVYKRTAEPTTAATAEQSIPESLSVGGPFVPGKNGRMGLCTCCDVFSGVFRIGENTRSRKKR